MDLKLKITLSRAFAIEQHNIRVAVEHPDWKSLRKIHPEEWPPMDGLLNSVEDISGEDYWHIVDELIANPRLSFETYLKRRAERLVSEA